MGMNLGDILYYVVKEIMAKASTIALLIFGAILGGLYYAGWTGVGVGLVIAGLGLLLTYCGIVPFAGWYITQQLYLWFIPGFLHSLELQWTFGITILYIITMILSSIACISTSAIGVVLVLALLVRD